MKYLKISNTGLLDMRLIYLMGGTTKANDQYKIGQFGTGLKYSLAFMLRNNIDFKIFIDGKQVELSTQKEIIRDTEFEIIYINKDRTSITTNMGPDWKPWMIVRELWCNALDELDPEYSVVDEIIATEGKTDYFIQMLPEIKDVVDNWSKYFIHDKEPIMETEDFAIYDGGKDLHCYKNGVLIKTIKCDKSVFSYDFKKTKLNELRQMEWSLNTEFSCYAPDFDKKTAEMFIENVKGSYEETLDLLGYFDNGLGSGWKEVVGDGKYMDEKTYEKVKDRLPEIAQQAVVIVPTILYKALSKSFPKISMMRASSSMHEFFETYSDRLNDKIKKCTMLLESVGYFIDPNLKIITGVFGDKGLMGEIHFDDKEIRLNQDLENMSDSELIVTLIEENEHYKTGFSDCTRDFQNHFIKLYSNILLRDVKVLI